MCVSVDESARTFAVWSSRCTAAGYLFGHSCIEQALRSRKQCPTCNAPARKRHLRLLFAPASQVVLDTSERDRVLQQLEEERRRHQQVSRRPAWRRGRRAQCICGGPVAAVNVPVLALAAVVTREAHRDQAPSVLLQV
jgi:hypothetical protein